MKYYFFRTVSTLVNMQLSQNACCSNNCLNYIMNLALYSIIFVLAEFNSSTIIYNNKLDRAFNQQHLTI
jgi:hypothetical protein